MGWSPTAARGGVDDVKGDYHVGWRCLKASKPLIHGALIRASTMVAVGTAVLILAAVSSVWFPKSFDV